MEDRRERLDALGDPRSRADDERVGVDGPEVGIRRQHGGIADLRGQFVGSVEPEPAWRHDHDLGAALGDVGPRNADRVGTRSSQHRPSARRGDEVRHPVASGERRIGPLQHERRPLRRTGNRRLDGSQPGAARRHDLRRTIRRACRCADSEHRIEDLVQRRRIERQHVGPAAEVRQRVVDLGDVDGADRTEVLGEHERRIELGEGAAVQPVEVLPRRHAFLDDGIDLRRTQACGQCGGRHDALGAGLGGKVALERDADDLIVETEEEQDLRCGRQQRDDAHAAIMPLRAAPGLSESETHRARTTRGAHPACRVCPSRLSTSKVSRDALTSALTSPSGHVITGC